MVFIKEHSTTLAQPQTNARHLFIPHKTPTYEESLRQYMSVPSPVPRPAGCEEADLISGLMRELSLEPVVGTIDKPDPKVHRPVVEEEKKETTIFVKVESEDLPEPYQQPMVEEGGSAPAGTFIEEQRLIIQTPHLEYIRQTEFFEELNKEMREEVSGIMKHTKVMWVACQRLKSTLESIIKAAFDGTHDFIILHA